MRMLIAVLIIVFAPFPAIAAERLCPSIKPLPKESESLEMREDDFTEKRFLEGLDYFKNYLPKQFEKYDSMSALRGREGFWIGYRNSHQFIEGYMLKQDAQLERARNKEKGTKSTDAVDAFCQFVKYVRYVD